MEDGKKKELMDKREIKGPNALLNSKGAGSLTTQKIFSAGMLDMSVDNTNHVVAHIPMEELKRIFGKSHSIYNRITEITDKNYGGDNLYDWFLYEKNDDAQEVESMQVITNAKYARGGLHIRYNESVTNQLLSLKKDFTTFLIGDIYAMKSVYGLRLYQILKSGYDKQAAITGKKDTKMFTYHVTELKFLLGAVTHEGDKRIKDELGKEYPDYDRVEELLKEKPNVSYKEFKVFNRDVVKKAVAEVNEKTVLNVEVDQYKEGRQVKGFNFFVKYKACLEDKIKDPLNSMAADKEVINQGAVLDEVSPVLFERFSYTEIALICRTADYNRDDILSAYKYYKNYESPIDNDVAFMRACIKERWFEKKPGKNIPAATSGRFNNFPQNEYDFKELEEKLLDN